MSLEKLTGTCDFNFSVKREYVEEKTRDTVAWITRQIKAALKNANFTIEHFHLIDWEGEGEEESEPESPD